MEPSPMTIDANNVSLRDIPRILPLLSLSEQEQLLAQLDKLEKLKNRKLSQQKFLPFVKEMWPSFISGKHHAIMGEAFERVARGECKRLIICLPPRHAILTSMKIPTIAGFKTISELQTGDFVFGPDGVPTEVLGKSEVFKGRELYRVTTDDGASLVVDGDHLWTVRLDRKSGAYRDYTTEQLWQRQNGARLHTRPDGTVKVVPTYAKVLKPRLPRLPDVSAVQYSPSELPVDPYILGVWLGDGSKNNGVVTCHDDDATILRAEIERRGYQTTDQATKFTFGILGLKVQLRDLGVLSDKHIPRQYLEASVEQRIDLLRGLMDTDGCVSKEGQCFFAQSNYPMVVQVAELLRSLGHKAFISETEAKIGDKSYGPTWRVSFYATDIACLPRKEARTKKTPRGFGRYIAVEKLDAVGDTQCIRVAREDGLFLAGEGYICTHNTKSEFASFLLPAWFLGNHPNKKVIQASNTAELAQGFGRKVRNLVDSEAYHEIFPDVSLAADSQAAGRWSTNKAGQYFAIGVGGTMTGRGADLLIIDDPHSEKEAIAAESNPEIYDKVYEWYTSGPRQRLQPGAAVIIVQTRWSKRDLTGQVLKASAQRGGDEWEVIELPALFDGDRPLWPEFWSAEAMVALRDLLPAGKWMAQYQQNPVSEGSAIVKREWWKKWVKDEPPKCEFTITAWDTAFEKTNRADYSACTSWGVFFNEEAQAYHIIVLNSFKERLEFPELKKRALDNYNEWEPDSLIVEKKASGAPLIYELRAMGIPVQEFTPGKGQDKIARLNAVSDLFASGVVWAPNTHWAEELIEEVASFPAGEHDDLVDSATLALARFRQGGFMRLPSDEKDDVRYFKQKRGGAYY